MSGRATAEIVADLRDGLAFSHSERDLRRKAADRLAELDVEVAEKDEMGAALIMRSARIDALRLPCPTCGGTTTVPNPAFATFDSFAATLPCPDCSDGRMSHERAWNIVAAVFEKVVQVRHHGDYKQGWDELLDYLRGVR